jgi:hypothetical protein
MSITVLETANHQKTNLAGKLKSVCHREGLLAACQLASVAAASRRPVSNLNWSISNLKIALKTS